MVRIPLKRLKTSAKIDEVHGSTVMTSEVRGVEKTTTNSVITEDNGPNQEDICKAMKELEKKKCQALTTNLANINNSSNENENLTALPRHLGSNALGSPDGTSFLTSNR